MTSIYDSIRRQLTEAAEGDWPDEEDWLDELRENCGLSCEEVLRRLEALSGRGGAPKAAIASRCVLREDGDWRFRYELLAVPLEAIMALPELPAVRELEEQCLARLLAGRERLGQADMTLAELRLSLPDVAFRLLREIPLPRRALLTQVLSAHLPACGAIAPEDYLHALDLGIYSMVYTETVLYACALSTPTAPLRAAGDDWEEESLASALWELRHDAPWAGCEDNGLSEDAERELASISALYNALNLYRSLRYAKEELEKARYYLRAYAGLEELLPEKERPGSGE